MWGMTKKYPSLSWSRNFLGGHLNIGEKITIYGANAMNWAVNISTKRFGYICFTLPTLQRILGNREWYFYLSPNATPWACTFYRGSNLSEKLRAKIRKLNFGHGFKTRENEKALDALNNRFSSFRITEYDIERYSQISEEAE